jgi:putative drug exporter of the RND superfamily
MSNGLRRLGELMFKWKWWVIAFWIVIMLVLGFVASRVGFNTTSQLSIPGTQAQDTLEEFNEQFPRTGAQSSRVVIQVQEGETIADYQSQIRDLATEIATVEGVTRTVTPFEVPGAISEDNRIGFITVQMRSTGDAVFVGPETIQAVREHMDEARSETGLTIEAGGDLVNREPGGLLGVGEIIGLVLALVVLVVTLGSLIAAGMPLVTAIVAVGISMLGLISLSSLIEVTSTVPALAVMLGLAVGIDYSLFIINRYRTYVLDGYDMETAVSKTLGTAGNAVVFAAATVVIALSALAIVQVPFMTTMGLAAAATVAIAALVAITLIPALLGIFKMRLFGRKARKAALEQQKKGIIHHEDVNRKTVWYRIGGKITKYRKTMFVAALALVVLLAWPITDLRLGLPTDEVASTETSQRRTYDLLAEGFGAGYNAPMILLVENVPELTDEDRAAATQQVTQAAQAQAAATAAQRGLTIEQMQMAMTPEQQMQSQQAIQAQIAQFTPLYPLQRIAQNVAEVEGVEGAQAALINEDGTVGAIMVTPTTGPSDESTIDLVNRLRSEDVQATLVSGDTTIEGVTGTTAIQIDINDRLSEALPIYLAVVVGLSFIILMIAFRSILIPLKATLGFLLSVLAMFGAMVAVFQWGWFGITDSPAPIVSFIPIIATGILFGLAMDYEFFLVSGMQEAYHYSKNAKRAVVDGFAIGSRVVVAAALIMVSVFAGFIGSHEIAIQSIGFALALGVLIDAFIVRLIIVPIVMSVLGKHAWWLPKWLDKILPRVSIEGESK